MVAHELMGMTDGYSMIPLRRKTVNIPATEFKDQSTYICSSCTGWSDSVTLLLLEC